MGITVPPNHPLMELLAQLLFSIETVPAKEQRRMANRACREAVRWYEAELANRLQTERTRCADFVRTRGICVCDTPPEVQEGYCADCDWVACQALADKLERLE